MRTRSVELSALILLAKSDHDGTVLVAMVNIDAGCGA